MKITIRAIRILIPVVILAGSLMPGTARGQVTPEAGITERVSVASDGTQGNGQSDVRPSISADGRYVAFSSQATNLVDGDTNGTWDIFVHDRVTGETSRVSIASDGAQGNSTSWSSSISADGRYVAFISWASNLVDGDTDGWVDIFVHDRAIGKTSRVSIASDGTQGNNASWSHSISADGRYVAFESWADNLVSGDTNNFCGTYGDENCSDIFVHDRVTGETSRVSLASDGTQGNQDSGYPSISADGRYVGFYTYADNLVDGDTNGIQDVFVHDRVTGETSRVSLASDGTQGNGQSGSPSFSADGRYVTFDSVATNLVYEDTNEWYDVFVHDRATGETSRVSLASDGTQGNEHSYDPSISADGRYVAFFSIATNLVDGNTNIWHDIYVHDRATGETSRVSIASDGAQGNESSWMPSISADGRYVAFFSWATNLVDGDTNGTPDVFVHDREGVAYPISIRVTLPMVVK